MPPVPVLVSWSSGKDSAWTLHVLRQQPERYEVRGVFTTMAETFDRVSVHSTPGWVLREQAARLCLPVHEIPIPYPCSNAEYESAMKRFLDRLRALPSDLGATHLAFGDLFLEDIREYREAKLGGTGFTPIFPVWGRDTAALAEEMIAAGLRAITTSVDPTALPSGFAGRWFDRDFLADLPRGIDPLGENGEFHTCVVDGPMLSSPIPVRPGKVVSRAILTADEEEENDPARSAPSTYVYCDLVRAP